MTALDHKATRASTSVLGVSLPTMAAVDRRNQHFDSPGAPVHVPIRFSSPFVTWTRPEFPREQAGNASP